MRKFYLLFISLLGLTLSAQNINSTILETNFGGDSEPEHLTRVGNKIFFSADLYSNRELYVKDDLTSKARLVKDIHTIHGSIHSDSFFKDFNGILLFTAASNAIGNHYKQLWRSDGTSNGTYLLKIINPNHDTNIIKPIILGNKMFFISSVNNSNDLWVTDGTETGTKIVKKINSGNSNVMHPFVYNNEIYFLANDGITGNELWKTDGTEAGTTQVIDLNVGSYSVGFTQPIVYNNKIYIVGINHLNQQGLWSYDGTNAQLVKSLPHIEYFEAVIFQNKLFFTTYGSNGMHLWHSDGTPNNTVPLLSDPAATPLTIGQPLRVFNNKLLFSADNFPLPSVIWTSEGTAQSTVSLSSYIPLLENTSLVKISTENKFLIFRNNLNPVEHYISDGTIQGTKLISDIQLGYIVNALDYDNSLILNGKNKKNGKELFTYDLSTNSSNLLDDIHRRFSSVIGGSVSINNNLLYFGSSYDEGRELFFSDGTINNTHILKDINLGEGGSVESDTKFFKNGNKFYFKCSMGSGFEPCVTDGTAQGTYVIKDLNSLSPGSIGYPAFMALNDNITLFGADDGANNNTGATRLWRTDGTSTGTYKLHDIQIANLGVDFNNKQYGSLNGKVYFTGYDDSNDIYSIWETDGTSAGTKIFQTFYNFLGQNEIPRILNTVNSKLIIVVNDKVQSGQYFQDYWSTDGTSATSMVKFARFRKNVEYGSGVNISNTVVFNNKLYFYAFVFDGSYPNDAYKIYTTDGTAAGTSLFSNTVTGCCSADIKFTTCSNKIFILKDKLYVTDGNNNPVELTSSSNILQDFNCVGDKMFFTGMQYPSYKIWVSDGSPVGTVPLNLYANGHQLGNNVVMGKLVATGDKLFYNAYFQSPDELKNFGQELAVVDISSLTLNNLEMNISQKVEEEFLIFPNPARTTVNLQNLKSKNIKSVKVYNVSGKLISNVLYDKDKIEMSVEDLNKGLYFLVIKTETGIITRKLIKN